MSHGRNVPRGLSAEGVAPTARGRFGRMFGCLEHHCPDNAAIRALRTRISEAEGNFSEIPAGFTYLAQFVDHDITSDRTSLLDQFNDPYALENFRTPRLDLDSLYGSGPKEQPDLYDDECVRLRVGGDHTLRDLPRENGVAVIGDPRNDEHLIIAQLHLLFIQFHNAVVDALSDDLAGDALLREAQQTVRWHYQWIVLHEFLDHVLGERLADDVRRERRYYDWDTRPFIPVEFSAGAYRFAHSMVRSSYTINARHRDVPILAESTTLAETAHLSGSRPLPRGLEIDWRLFFALGPSDAPQTSRRIDRQVSRVLERLPASVNPDRASLIDLDLRRGRALGLPSGHAVARAMHAPVLTAAECPLPSSLQEAPLWYYVLCEAGSRHGDHGEHLGPVGGRIVGEVLVGLVDGDPTSYLRQRPGWRPTLARRKPRDFTMADLIACARP